MKLSTLNVPFPIALSLRSVLQATKITGIALPQIDRTSSIHFMSQLESHRHRCENELTFCVTLSSESGVSTENAIRMTWALEYDNGRSRSYSS